MKKLLLTTFALANLIGASAQLSSIGMPDSAATINVLNGTVPYMITNPLGNTGNGFSNSPAAVLISPNNNISEQLYFYDLDLNIPAGATITGVEVNHIHGGCNSGSYTIDSLYLAYNGAIVSAPQRDSASAFTTNISGNSSDLWSANLTPALVNDNSFGIILQSTTTGICTFSQADLQVEIFYINCMPNDLTGIPDSATTINTNNGIVSYNITNPLGYSGNGFLNSPIAVLISPNNNISDQLYFYDLDLNIPAGATITGVEVNHKHGGCNSGSYTIDSLFLAYNGAIISAPKRDSASAFTTNISGNASDLWLANLTPALVNDNSFGIILHSTTSGICTFAQADLQVKISYCSILATSADLDHQSDVKISPNPAETEVLLHVNEALIGQSYAIIDYLGKAKLTGTISHDNTHLDVTSLTPGMYFILVGNDNFKFIKR
ncbi:MAG: T9SS type A sorting domain-containing protein [Fluviicola sp.]